jgi:hypothetical protein
LKRERAEQRAALEVEAGSLERPPGAKEHAETSYRLGL